MRDEVSANKGMKNAPRNRPQAGQRRRNNALRGIAASIGLMVAILAIGAAWYLTSGGVQWLAGGLLAGLALVCSAFAVIVLLRESLSPSASSDANLLFSALDMSSNGRVITDANGVLLYANTVYREMAGGGRSDVLSPLDMVRGDAEAHAVLERLLTLARTGGQGQETIRMPNVGGAAEAVGHRWLRFAASDTGSAAGTIVWQVIDVTNPEAVRDGARQARAVLGDILDAVGAGCVVLDSDGKVRLANKTLRRWLGISADGGIMNKPLSDLLAVGEVLSPDLTTVVGRPLLFRKMNGDALPLDLAAFDRYYIPEAKRSYHVLVLRNVAELDAILAPTSADERFHRYFAEAPLGIATVDRHGRVIECNQLFQKYFPIYSEPGRHSLSEIISEPDLVEALNRIQDAVQRDAVPSPVDVRFKGEREKQAQLYVHRIDEGGTAEPRVVLYLIDVTDQKNLEVQFAQSQKMQAVGQLAGGIAHDFNNLLTAITGFCDLLLVRHGPGDQSFADIMQVKQNANRAANLVRQLLAFSRQQTLRPKILIITDVLAEISNLLRRLIGETIELKMLHGRNLGPVRVDQGQLEQVIINLAVNARDAMPGGGTLSIRTANVPMEEARKLGHAVMPPAEYVLIEVSDTGTGIPKEILGKIFEPFFSTKEVGKGTGLGLSTVYGIVKQTGGFIFPHSEPNQGAIFRIYLPTHQVEVGAEIKEIAAPVPEKAKDLSGKGTILLVEDEDAVRLFASRALKNKGYNVLEANSGEQALEVVENHGQEIDLLISDVVMPNMDGPTLVKAIREQRYNMKIIFISGYAEDAFRKNLGKDAEFNFLPKPFSLKQLAEKVKDVLEA